MVRMISKDKTTCGDTMWNSLNLVVISSEKELAVTTRRFVQYALIVSPDDNQSMLTETLSCNLQFFSELITTQLRDFHMVSPQVVFTLLVYYIFLGKYIKILPDFDPCSHRRVKGYFLKEFNQTCKKYCRMAIEEQVSLQKYCIVKYTQCKYIFVTKVLPTLPMLYLLFKYMFGAYHSPS